MTVRMYIPGSKWGRVNPRTTGVITYLLSGMNHQVSYFSTLYTHYTPCTKRDAFTRGQRNSPRSWKARRGPRGTLAGWNPRLLSHNNANVRYTSIASLDFPCMPYHSSSQWGSVVNPPRSWEMAMVIGGSWPTNRFCGERPYTNSPWILQVPSPKLTLKQRFKESSFPTPDIRGRLSWKHLGNGKLR